MSRFQVKLQRPELSRSFFFWRIFFLGAFKFASSRPPSYGNVPTVAHSFNRMTAVAHLGAAMPTGKAKRKAIYSVGAAVTPRIH
mmetsp:Transcript_58999/g.95372  ORF Transcript_58999/g.95372 Transcript_58999/m.95372 type:complete len:84 (-) Transcript_58999:246-497(-)